MSVWNGSQTPALVDDLLDQIESFLPRAAGSAGVSTFRIRICLGNIFPHFGAVRDILLKSLSDPQDFERVQLLTTFGGDCSRISRTRALLEAVGALMGPAAMATTDQRFTQCLNACDVVEKVLRGLGLGWRLEGAVEKQRAIYMKRVVEDEVDTVTSIDDSGSLLQKPFPTSHRQAQVPCELLEDQMNNAIWNDDSVMSLQQPHPTSHRQVSVPCAHRQVPVPCEVWEESFSSRSEAERKEYAEGDATPIDDSDGDKGSLAIAVPVVLATAGLAAKGESTDDAEGDIAPVDVSDEVHQRSHASTVPSAELAARGEAKEQQNTEDAGCDITPVGVSDRHYQRTVPINESVALAAEGEAEQQQQILGLDMFDGAISADQWNLIQQLFAHYRGPAGTSGANGLGMARFRHFLRDCGMLDKGQAISQWYGMSLAQADITLVRAAGAVGDKQTVQKIMSADTFAAAILDIAVRHSSSGSPKDLFEAFCNDILHPLAKRLARDLADDVPEAAELISEKRGVGLILARNSCRNALSNIFRRYAIGVGSPGQYRQGHLTPQSFSRFATDAGLNAELSHSALHGLFAACVTHVTVTSNNGRNLSGSRVAHVEKGMPFSGFVLALVVIMRRIPWGASVPLTEREKLRKLLLRLGDRLGAGDLFAVANGLNLPAQQQGGA